MAKHSKLEALSLSDSRWRRLPDFIRLMRLDRPIGIYLLLWPTLWAVWIANDGLPPLDLILIFIGGVVLMRSGGCVINDFADRDFDGHVWRTAGRPLATGRISSKEALILAAVIGLLAFGLVLMTNLFTIALSVGGLMLACAYPFMKRYTYFPQVILGAAFAWAIPMAFGAASESVPTYAWLIYMATLLWTMAYDTLYAMADREDDLKVGIKSTAILFGEADLLMIGLLEACALLALIFLGGKLGFSIWYYLGLVIAVCLWAWQLWQARTRDPMTCFKCFLHNHWVGAAVFAGIFLHYNLS